MISPVILQTKEPGHHDLFTTDQRIYGDVPLRGRFPLWWYHTERGAKAEKHELRQEARAGLLARRSDMPYRPKTEQNIKGQ
ncbi:hypothetical protein TNCV_2159241 [Trichonephila clavipes]|nr:hypothetical protein TNCV_2159241 [Trichonephila clavipes]